MPDDLLGPYLYAIAALVLYSLTVGLGFAAQALWQRRRRFHARGHARRRGAS
jgi:hypothetical protein